MDDAWESLPLFRGGRRLDVALAPQAPDAEAPETRER
jgi:hypothetical protein